MAAMYKETQDGYFFEKTEGHIIGQRTYVRDDDNGTVAAAALPAVGSSTFYDHIDDTAIATCICRKKRFTWIGGQRAYVFTYSTVSATSSPGREVSTDTSSSRFDVRINTEPIDPFSNDTTYAWESDDEPCRQPIYVNSGLIEFTVPKEVADGSWAAYKATVVGLIGKTNAAAYKDFGIGTVRFDGMTGGDTLDETGTRVWRVDLRFSVKIVPGISTNTWNYTLRGDGTWDRPHISGSPDVFLYTSGDFSTL